MIMYGSPPSRYIYVFKRKELERLRDLEPYVNWETDERIEFFHQLDSLVQDWMAQLPNLNSIFQQDAIDFLLAQAAILDHQVGLEFIRFVWRTGYKDRFDVPKDVNNSLLRRTTATHHAARNKPKDWERKVEDLFKIYDRFDVNYVDDFGLTHFHAACMVTNCANVVRKFLEQALVDPNLVWPETGDSPLHLSVRHDCSESAVILMRNGADMNLTNDGGQTPLHIICQNNRSYTSFNTDYVREETFIKMTKEMNQLVQVDARDKLGRTPLQWAVASLLPHTVDWLLDHGADLSSFVLLPENEFTARFDPNNRYDSSYFKLGIASGALAILESLEKRGYKVEDYALIIMKIFSRLRLFKKSTYIQTRRYDEEKFVSKAKHIKILPRISIEDYFLEFKRVAMTPSLSLYDLIRLRPEEATKILTYRDYYDLDRSKDLRRLMLPGNYYKDVMDVYLYEKVPRGFCRRWARDYFFELIRYRLPILCCEKIIDQLMNVDLCNICFAATGQDPY